MVVCSCTTGVTVYFIINSVGFTFSLHLCEIPASIHFKCQNRDNKELYNSWLGQIENDWHGVLVVEDLDVELVEDFD